MTNEDCEGSFLLYFCFSGSQHVGDSNCSERLRN